MPGGSKKGGGLKTKKGNRKGNRKGNGKGNGKGKKGY